MYEKLTLSNGIRIVYENIPYVRSVSAGIWVGTGSRFEKAYENGASHFIEHMIFKGTEQRSASCIASLMDELGGQINAFTTKECTCFYGRVLDTQLRFFFDILSDMFFHSSFTEDNIINERSVIFEEIDMYEDTPEDLVCERLFSKVYRPLSLARPILGKKATLAKMDGNFLRQYMTAHYLPENIVIAISGRFTASDIDYIKSLFSSMTQQYKQHFQSCEYVPAFTVKHKSIEQNHLCIAFPGISLLDDSRYAMQLLNNILGGGMSSRLFQTVRENSGLCYSVYSFCSSHSDTGLFCIYTALSRETEKKALALILQEIQKIKDTGVTQDELRRARDQIKANMLMGLESTSSRMNHLGKSELFLGSAQELDTILDAYDQVTPKDILALANQHFAYDLLSFSAVGKVDSAETYQDFIHSINI